MRSDCSSAFVVHLTSGMHLPTLPRSADRTGLRQSSPQKREFLRCGLETFGRFSLRLPNSRCLETDPICEIPGKCRYFPQFDHTLRSRECVAGAGGIEPPNGGIKIRCLT